MSGATDFWIRWRVRMGYPVGVLAFWFARPQPAWILLGVAIGCLGLLVRGYAAGYLQKHKQLATSGPYAYTRNPLYFGSVLLAAGFSVASRSWISAGLLAVYLLVFYPMVIRREQEELQRLYGASFAEYAARVPAFWLRLGTTQPGAGFSWQLYMKNREYEAAIGLSLTMVLLGVLWFWRR